MVRAARGKWQREESKGVPDIEIRRSDWANVITQVFLPVEKVYKVQAGKKVMREKNFYPGYVMIEAIEGK